MPPLIVAATLPPDLAVAIRALTIKTVTAMRAQKRRGGVDSLVQEYALSSQEGVALMCLAEALLRIPDNGTRDALIADKIEQWRLAGPSRRQPVAVRQCRDLGPDGDRQAGHRQWTRRAGRALTRLVARARRAGDPPGVDWR